MELSKVKELVFKYLNSNWFELKKYNKKFTRYSLGVSYQYNGVAFGFDKNNDKTEYLYVVDDILWIKENLIDEIKNFFNLSEDIILNLLQIWIIKNYNININIVAKQL